MKTQTLLRWAVLFGGKSFHAFQNRTHKTSPPIPSGRWCWLFLCTPCLSCVCPGVMQGELAARRSLKMHLPSASSSHHLPHLPAFCLTGGVRPVLHPPVAGASSAALTETRRHASYGGKFSFSWNSPDAAGSPPRPSLGDRGEHKCE